MRRLCLCLLLFLCVSAFAFGKELPQRGGFYLIGSAEDLAEFAALVNEGADSLCARMTADIDFRAYPTTMIGTETHCAFSGTFDGQGHCLTLGLRIMHRGDYSGSLFRFVRNASFRNLTLRGSLFTHGKHGAGLVCSAEGVCSFTNVLSDVDISSDSFDDCIGGLVGIAGENFLPRSADVTFMNCAFTGSIRYSGENPDFISRNGTFTHHGGCFVGWKGKWNTKIYMINCYASPRAIDHSNYFNTFVRYWSGRDVGLIYAKNCYYSSRIADYGRSISYNENQGEAKSPVEFADGRVCRLLNNGNVQNPIWCQTQGEDSLPRPTCSEFQLTGMQTVLIGTEEELEHFAQAVNAGNVRQDALLTADIDYRGHREMIGTTTPYEGFFDGACHKITIDFDTEKEDPALFQRLGHGGIVRNLHVDGTITSRQPYTAGIVSRMDGGFVGNCLSTVDITSRHSGDGVVGGIAGRTCGNSVISNCIYSGTIDSDDGHAASLVGVAQEPGLLIRNSLFLNEAPADSTQESHYPLFRGDPRFVSVENSFTVGNSSSVYASLGHVSMHSLQNAEMLYSIWGRENFVAEKTIATKERQIRRANLYWGLLSMLFVFLILVVAQYAYYNKTLQQKYELLYRSALRDHQTWLQQQAEAMQADGALPPSPADDLPADPTDKSSLKQLYARLIQTMEEQQLYTASDLDRQTVARQLATNEHYLSDCISHFSEYPNFNAWLASYRINHALQLIEENPNLNVEQLYLLSGFANHTTFTRHFRAAVGMTCKQYLMMKQKNAQNGK